MVSFSVFWRMHAHTKVSQFLSTTRRKSKKCRSGKSALEGCIGNRMPCRDERLACHLARIRANHRRRAPALAPDNSLEHKSKLARTGRQPGKIAFWFGAHALKELASAAPCRCRDENKSRTSRPIRDLSRRW